MVTDAAATKRIFTTETQRHGEKQSQNRRAQRWQRPRRRDPPGDQRLSGFGSRESSRLAKILAVSSKEEDNQSPKRRRLRIIVAERYRGSRKQCTAASPYSCGLSGNFTEELSSQTASFDETHGPGRRLGEDAAQRSPPPPRPPRLFLVFPQRLCVSAILSAVLGITGYLAQSMPQAGRRWNSVVFPVCGPRRFRKPFTLRVLRHLSGLRF